MGIVFLVFAKAFDRVAHNILLRCVLNWCKDYLTDQEQRVVIEGINCTWCAILSGVPRGSLLGPWLFVIFISDLPEVVMLTTAKHPVINFPADHFVFQSGPSCSIAG